MLTVMYSKTYGTSSIAEVSALLSASAAARRCHTMDLKGVMGFCWMPNLRPSGGVGLGGRLEHLLSLSMISLPMACVARLVSSTVVISW